MNDWYRSLIPCACIMGSGVEEYWLLAMTCWIDHPANETKVAQFSESRQQKLLNGLATFAGMLNSKQGIQKLLEVKWHHCASCKHTKHTSYPAFSNWSLISSWSFSCCVWTIGQTGSFTQWLLSCLLKGQILADELRSCLAIEAALPNKAMGLQGCDKDPTRLRMKFNTNTPTGLDVPFAIPSNQHGNNIPAEKVSKRQNVLIMDFSSRSDSFLFDASWIACGGVFCKHGLQSANKGL